MEVTVTEQWNLLNYVHIIYHVLVVSITLYIVGLSLRDYKHLLSWHAILGTISFLTLITESITIFSDDVWYFTWLTRQEKILIHGILLSIATLFAVLATALEYYRKRKLQFHYDTVHGVTGLAATILLIITMIGGYLAANPELSCLQPKWIKLIHNLFGQLSYFVGIISICLSYFSRWLSERQRLSTEVRLLITFITFFIIIWSLGHPIYSVIEIVYGY